MADAMDIDTPTPRGTKRKADESRLTLQAPKRIKALDQNVVNKIAAGEIIVAPMHALKELIENAVDAGSTSLEIVVKDGGLKLLQITDNGHGINKDDLPILCERFTTSKLKTFEDLTSIGTYGFRGEALASISHIAHLTVTTKTADSSCAWRAQYADGKLVPAKPGQSADPRPTAGRGGTQITVEDLFYSIPSRQRAFKAPSEEYAKILDVVGRYAVHCAGVSFSCKKHGDSAMGISVPSNAGTIDRIRQTHGSSVANELIQFDVSDGKWGFKASGWASNANYYVKKTTILLFINHRAVESGAIKKAIEQTYSTFLPKGGHPFIYLSIHIDPQRVDVNVHPTKREVNFLNEEEIIQSICDNVRLQLSKVDTSRTFMTQSLLPGVRIPTITSSTSPAESRRVSKDSPLTPSSGSRPTPRPAENNLIRTDSKLRKITSMLPPTLTPTTSSSLELQYTHSVRQPIHCRLTTVKDLRATVRSTMHASLTSIFASHTYVGLVDPLRRIVAIQSGVKLFLVDYGMLCNEYFYQVGLTDFGNFGSIAFATPLSVRALIEVGVRIEREEKRKEKGKEKEKARNQGQPQQPQQQEAEEKDDEDEDDDIDWDEIPDLVTKQLIERREMLLEYFSLDINETGDLLSLPLLMKGYTPSLAKLPRFLMRLGPCVDWTDEKNCFHTFLRELAAFYTPEQLPCPRSANAARGEDGNRESVRDVGVDVDLNGERERESEDADADADAEIAHRRDYLARTLEHVLFPAFRARLVATKGLLKGVVEVANLKGLYKVFERC